MRNMYEHVLLYKAHLASIDAHQMATNSVPLLFSQQIHELGMKGQLNMCKLNQNHGESGTSCMLGQAAG